ncbi:hypothetical protein [Burkholderia diffusa]|uniref:hypothetical protein n=1 Tax=Burkholderia diffusa TaxID=488732 RepID=UPI00157AD9BE|nr:hypothetical protein [Burkholderia diffusa]
MRQVRTPVAAAKKYAPARFGQTRLKALGQKKTRTASRAVSRIACGIISLLDLILPARCGYQRIRRITRKRYPVGPTIHVLSQHAFQSSV